MNSRNATMPAVARAEPAQYLFRTANPALSSRALGRRDSVGPICAEYETKCAQGDWCCDTGETCSFDTVNGSFLCCGATAGPNGCSKVCAAGTFQCGSVCCTYGQVCFGGDTVSGYCINQQNTLSSSASRTLPGTVIVTTQTLTRHSGLPAGTQAAGPLYSPNEANQNNNNNNNGNNGGSQQGISVGVQVAIGVAVPIVVIFLAILAWFCFSRFRRNRQAPAVTKDMESSSPSPSPAQRNFPSLPKNAMIVQTPVQPFEFGQPRTPKTSLPPPETSAGTVLSEDDDQQQGTPPVIAPPRLATPIDLLTAVAGKRSH
ncbi:hypothetical protein QBC47DRAFT_393601 [Echria macrotheca]|uniref:Uncharacterized protein n=1 Tax=Echria macrotheca TaxID=438768 RepID=A0AAJ0B3G9_9PEZI|nr:hypothetical protein QBC47DRAFT_393601 [Echria macrotheca]